MTPTFKDHITAAFPFLEGHPILVACSGGVDSMTLAHLSIQAGLEVTLAHCNFKLRGKESDDDEALVRQWARTHNVAVITKSFDTQTYAAQHRGSLQMAARTLRYRWFQELVDSRGFAYVLTAHHADDTLETFLINLSRGTGIDGLLGIPAQQGNIIRPLLPYSRNTLLDYAKAEGIAWREDQSNADPKYLRNKIRHELVPTLKTLHPAFLNNFKRTQQHLQQTQSLLREHLSQTKQSLFETYEDYFIIDIQKLLQLQPLDAYLYGLFSEYGFTAWQDIPMLLAATSGKQIYSKTHSLLKDRTHLILSKRTTEVIQVFQVSETGTCDDAPVQLVLESVISLDSAPRNVIYVDKEKLKFPLQLRKWEKGDYFYPFGGTGKKKLSKFFKDERMHLKSKAKQWLLCSGNAIVWVVGRRPDDRFKVDPTTQNIIKITCVT